MKFYVSLMVAVVTAMAGAQVTPTQETRAQASGARQSRLDQIWSYANSRLDQQMDVWFQNGEFLADIQLLRVTTVLRPDDYESWTNLGWMLENVQDWDSALAVYKEYRADNPKDADSALPLGDYLYRRKQYADVTSVLEPFVGRTPPPHPNVVSDFAHAYERVGKLKEAERVWKAYIAVAPKDAAAKVNLARVEKKLGDAGGKS